MKCFLIDDDEDDRDIFISALNRINPSFTCATAIHGEDALSILKDKPEFVPDVIFLDLNMPRMDGRTCLKELKKKPLLSDIPIIIFTTSSHHKDVNDTFILGASHYLVKPTSFNILVATLTSYFEGNHSDFLLTV